jgi:hypothetical protein
MARGLAPPSLAGRSGGQAMSPASPERPSSPRLFTNNRFGRADLEIATIKEKK